MADAGRCPWCGNDPLYVHYHDTVWGRPEHDDLALFEKLCLDGQQAGLSWITILRKQDSYRAAYAHFDPEKIARFDDAKVDELMQDPGIIRNRLKVHSVIKNARAYLALREQGIGFSEFLWSFVDHQPVQNHWQSLEEVPVATDASEAMSRALKKAGFTFVGPVIVYAFMQATGMVNDHLVQCPQHRACYLLSQ
ncbi:DNA-3-methyladenine glycosylase I [Marinobacter gudaonensis]|uniref:DNA-3-methyladenine glycosylase I n=1 Tax=Marinobacter gudaonensis TaxID=375760 RepID=A0A1I6H3Z4_9GAMM|nr:DNA-3-methyladenine glycosylase I [Marinobacter gudaonensis]SFR49140.1 DNA-3-methyladenine glycosylase I [Marinobacter gudaonensis]